MSSAILEGLNNEQYRAVTEKGSMLVLAGAGSGKTRVLSSRVANLISQGVPEENILAVTFTNKASKEMKSRIELMLGDESPNLWIGTFHGISNKILRDNATALGINPNFHILDDTDQKAIVKRILKDLKITNDDLKIYNETLGSVVRKISAKKEGKEPFSDNPNLIETVYNAYQATCAQEDAFDFNDLLIKVNEALRDNVNGIRDMYRSRFTHILVDEFQDTNPQQYEWLGAIKSPDAELFAVGDDDQSIYAFRGADPQSMSNFLDEFAGGKVIRLETNYRSTSNILAAANAIIAINEGRIGKTLRTDKGAGDAIHIRPFARDRNEADFIANHVKKLLADGVPTSEIAILYRSNHQSGAIESAMLKSSVPYVIHGGLRFFERQEIKDVLAYVRLTTKVNDNTAFMRVFNHPPRGLGGKWLIPIEQEAKERDMSYLEIANEHADNPGSKVVAFVDMIDEFKMAMEMLELPDFLEYVIEKSTLYEYYQKDPEAENRLRNIEELVAIASRYIAENNDKSPMAQDCLAEFLTTFTLDDISRNEVKNHAVTLMTIHAAKGLEFDHVIVTGVENKSLPHSNALEVEGGVEEERRLMYVAVTRAKKSLQLLHSRERYIFGQLEERDASPFLTNIPMEVAEHHLVESGYFQNENANYKKRYDDSIFGDDDDDSEDNEDDKAAEVPAPKKSGLAGLIKPRF